MNAPVCVRIEGVGVWSPELPGWPAARAWLAAPGAALPAPSAPRPAPSVLAANERRRAPDSVLLALDAAQQACAMAARDPATLPHVFASANGDIAISDYLCTTLALAPREVSPTKFHNSVHNAPAGYWAIATGCHENSTALSAGAHTFGAALLETALLVAVERHPALLALYDVPATGLLTQVLPCDCAFAAAFVLAPDEPEQTGPRLRLALTPGSLAPEPDVLHAVYARNPAARCLPLLAALAQDRAARLRTAAAPDLILDLETTF
jgi:hypothetical protein